MCSWGRGLGEIPWAAETPRHTCKYRHTCSGSIWARSGGMTCGRGQAELKGYRSTEADSEYHVLSTANTHPARQALSSRFQAPAAKKFCKMVLSPADPAQICFLQEAFPDHQSILVSMSCLTSPKPDLGTDPKRS